MLSKRMRTAEETARALREARENVNAGVSIYGPSLHVLLFLIILLFYLLRDVFMWFDVISDVLSDHLRRVDACEGARGGGGMDQGQDEAYSIKAGIKSVTFGGASSGG